MLTQLWDLGGPNPYHGVSTASRLEAPHHRTGVTPTSPIGCTTEGDLLICRARTLHVTIDFVVVERFAQQPAVNHDFVYCGPMSRGTIGRLIGVATIQEEPCGTQLSNRSTYWSASGP